MEPISLIISALTIGAREAVKAGSEAAGQDAYNTLKAMIKRKFAGEPAAEMILEEHEQEPETYEVPLKKKLIQAGLDRDEEIIQTAQELLKESEPEAAATGKFDIKVEGDIKGIVGDISGGDVNQSIT